MAKPYLYMLWCVGVHQLTAAPLGEKSRAILDFQIEQFIFIC